MLKKTLLLALLTVIVAAGLVQIHLVAQEQEGPAPVASAELTEQAARAFADKLDVSQSLAKEFAAALRTPAGPLVLRERASEYEARVYDQLRATAIPKFFKDTFDKTPSGLALKREMKAWRARFLEDAESMEADVALVKKTMARFADRMSLERDIDKLLHRFLTDANAPVLLYVRELRGQTRPDEALMERVFGRVFALRRDGKYAIRPDQLEQAKELGERFEAAAKTMSVVRAELVEFAKHVEPGKEPNDIQSRVIAALNDKAFAQIVAVDLMEQGKADVARVDMLMERLDEAFLEGASGLVLREEAKEDVAERISEAERVKQVAAMIRGPVARFAEKVADDDATHRLWREVLRSDLAVARIAAELEYGVGDPEQVVEEFLGHALTEGEDGKLRAGGSEVSVEELVEGLTEIFRETRAAARRFRRVRPTIERIEDSQLRTAMLTDGGKLAIADSIRDRIRREIPDGMTQWIGEHFEQSDDKYVLRSERDVEESIREMISDIQSINKEQEDADF